MGGDFTQIMHALLWLVLCRQMQFDPSGTFMFMMPKPLKYTLRDKQAD